MWQDVKLWLWKFECPYISKRHAWSCLYYMKEAKAAPKTTSWLEIKSNKPGTTPMIQSDATFIHGSSVTLSREALVQPYTLLVCSQHPFWVAGVCPVLTVKYFENHPCIKITVSLKDKEIWGKLRVPTTSIKSFYSKTRLHQYILRV